MTAQAYELAEFNDDYNGPEWYIVPVGSKDCEAVKDLIEQADGIARGTVYLMPLEVIQRRAEQWQQAQEEMFRQEA